jgi:hypothetical protein
MADIARLTVTSSQGEAELICALLRAEGIECFERVTDRSAALPGGTVGGVGWREVYVSELDLDAARELLATRSD